MTTIAVAAGRVPTSRPTLRQVLPTGGSESCARGTAGQNAAPPERGQQRRQQRQAGDDHDRDPEREDRAHLARGVEIGQRQHEHRDDHDPAGRQDRRPGALGGARHRLPHVLGPAQLVPEASDDQQAVVRARAEHQHDQDRRRLAAGVRDAGGDERVGQPARDDVGHPDDEDRDQRDQRRAVDRQQQQDEDAARDQQQRLVDALDGRAAVGLEAGLAGDVGVQARRVAGGRRHDRADHLHCRLGRRRAVVGHQRAGQHEVVVRGDQQRPAGADVQRVLLTAGQPVRRADQGQRPDRARVADRTRLPLDRLPVLGREPAVAHVGDHRRHLAAADELLVDQPLGGQRLRPAHLERVALVGRFLLERALQRRHRGREHEPQPDHGPARTAAGRQRRQLARARYSPPPTPSISVTMPFSV